MSLIHGYLGGANTSKMIDKEGRVVTDHRMIEKQTPYGVISFDVKVIMKVQLGNKTLTICDSSPSMRDANIPVGEALTTP